MMVVELEVLDIQNLLGIVNAANIKGQDAETIANLKIKLRAGLPPGEVPPEKPTEGGG